MSKRVMSAAGAAAFTALLAACGSGAVATVNGEPISRSAFYARLEDQPAATAVLRSMVELTLLEQYAKDPSVNVTVTSDEIDARVRLLKEMYPGDAWTRILTERHMDEAQTREFALVQLLYEKELAREVHVTPAQVAAYFKRHHARFDRPGHPATFAYAAPMIAEVLRERQEGGYALGLMPLLRQHSSIRVLDPRYVDLFPTPPPGNKMVVPLKTSPP